MRVFPVYTAHWRLPGPSVHLYLPPPPAPLPMCPHIEIMHPLRLLVPGRFTSNVEFDGFRVAKDGHDVGTTTISDHKFKPKYSFGLAISPTSAISLLLGYTWSDMEIEDAMGIGVKRHRKRSLR